MTSKLEKYKSKKSEYIHLLDDITTQCLALRNNIDKDNAEALLEKIGDELLLYGFHLENMLEDMISYMENNE